MKRFLFIILLSIISLYSLLNFPGSVRAEISNPYVIDEKPQVIFGDSVSITTASSTYYGLENYTYNYVNNYLHITFSYTHHGCCFASYPPALYVTGADPTSTTSPTVKYNYSVYHLASQPKHLTGIYFYDIQFDSTGYTVVVTASSTEIANFHTDISDSTTSDWAALANHSPRANNNPANPMSFTPLPIYSTPTVTVATTTPVIIVPGIASSYLHNSSGEEVWINIPKMLVSVTDSYLDELELSVDGSTSQNIIVEDIVKETGNNDFYTSLLEKLNLVGLNKNSDFFESPYDWRLDVETTASQLKNKIDQIKSTRGVSQVNIIAHSMGGLLVKKYLEDHNDGSVDKFINIGTPHTGAPKAFKILNYGDNFDASILYGLFGLSSAKIKEISQNMPAVYQLLPSKNYFTEDPGYYVFNGVGGNNRLDFNETKDYLKQEGRNPALVDRAEAFHDEIDNLNPADYGVETYNFVGCGTPTLGQFYILDKKDDEYIYNIKMINGDGTVPIKSAEAMPADKTYYVKNAVHATMPSAIGVRDLIADILAATSTENLDISVYSNISMSSSGCNIPDGKIVSFHSPIELHVYDQTGNHVGPDSNGDIENEISGVIYEIIGDNKFAYLPTGTTYTIRGNATGEGSFDVRIQEIVNGEVATTTLWADISLASTTQAEFAIGTGVPSQIALDHNNDGVYEYVLNQTSSSSGLLESTGKSVIMEEVNRGSISRDFIKIVAELTVATSVERIIESTTIPVTLPILEEVRKPEVAPAEQQAEANVEETIEENVEQPAAVYKSLGGTLKAAFKKWWLWFKNKL